MVQGQTVLSGDKDGLVAVSRPCTAMTFRVLSDHQGAPISTIDVTRKEVKQPQELGSRARCWGGGDGVLVGVGARMLGGVGAGVLCRSRGWDARGAGAILSESTVSPHPPHSQCGDLGVEGTDLWLVASGDQRVSVWASNWLRNRCELVDWLSFPTPAATEVRHAPGTVGGASAHLPGHSTAPLQTQGQLPPSLAAFCPWDGALLMYVGPGVYKEVIIYNLCQKQVVEKIPLPFFAMSLSLSLGTRLLAIGFAECMLRLVDCATGTTQDFAGHDNAVHLCRFTPSARLLFTAACNEILVWEVASG
ncbi:WD repeat-containing protein 90 [Saguinus oedipus]|uniref:WD repeat-containing protein 90 n=1 Tax=Saguinus oedipus TaxID=9490 RepID=A0ABQ9UJD2_SAGOE|nr:WD repeat-containing protein 90 [Saguinus oedipus]